MAKLSVTPRGQVTFRKELLDHLGIQPGDKIEVDLLPQGRAELRAARPAMRPMGGFRRLQGSLDGKTNGRNLTIDEIGEAIAESGSRAGPREA